MNDVSDQPSALLPEVCRLGQSAGAAIMAIYSTEFDVEHKDDDSPLTAADMASHRAIVAGLAELTPDVPVLSRSRNAPPGNATGSSTRSTAPASSSSATASSPSTWR